jgi:hypothetical protein
MLIENTYPIYQINKNKISQIEKEINRKEGGIEPNEREGK